MTRGGGAPVVQQYASFVAVAVNRNDDRRVPAIKVHDGLAAYQREKQAYERLRKHGVEEIDGFAVPQ